jgi:hypothetical protein
VSVATAVAAAAAGAGTGWLDSVCSTSAGSAAIKITHKYLILKKITFHLTMAKYLLMSPKGEMVQ